MRLSWILQGARIDKPTLGFKFRGKNRALRPIMFHQMLRLKENLEREEENMLWLRHPYLTIEQEHGHAKHLRKEKSEAFLEKMRLGKNRHWLSRQISIADRLKLLMVGDKWD